MQAKLQFKKQVADIPFVVISAQAKPKINHRRLESEQQELLKFAFTHSTRDQKELPVEKLTLDDLTAQLYLQEKKVKSSEYHIQHHGVPQIYISSYEKVPVAECKLISKMIIPLFDCDNYIIIESCEIIVELAKQNRNIRPMFEEGVLDSILKLLHSMDVDVLLAGIKAINVFSGEGVYLMRFVEKPNTISAIVSLIYSQQPQIKEISRSLYFKLKANREFLMEETYSLADDPWNLVFYKWRTADTKSSLIQYARNRVDKSEDRVDD